ncbi:MAG: hypothetical protein AB7F86_12265 [Bdellovibrionales bacterium]
MKRACWPGALIACFSISIAHAELNQQMDKPAVERTKGKPSIATWADGRKAELKVKYTDVVRTTIPFEVTENFCAAGRGKVMDLKLSVYVGVLSWIWTAHPKASKVGKVVQASQRGVTGPLDYYAFVSNGARFVAPDFVESLPPDELSFKNLDWLPGMSDGLKPLMIDTWWAEDMLPNPETGVAENRIISILNGVELQPTTATTSTVASVEGIYRLPLLPPAFVMFGDVVSWILTGEQGPCQINFKPNLALAIADVNELVGEDQSSYETYLWGEDELVDLLQNPISEEDLLNAEK